MDLQLGQLRAFVAVAEELHFGRAAERLHVTQPALSQQVRKLEVRLGVELFRRTSRSVVLTAPGAELLENARRVLAASDATWATARTHSDDLEEQIGVGFTGSSASRLLPRVLALFRERKPRVQVSLRELTDQRYDLLRERVVDVVFGRLQPGEMADLDVVILERLPRLAALWADHTLAGRSSITLGELRDDGFITQPTELNASYRDQWLAEQRDHGLPGRIAAEATSNQEILNLVAAGRGVCIVPGEAEQFNPWPGVVYVAVDDIEPTTTSLARRAGERGLADDFVKAARKAAGGVPAG